MKKYSKYIAVVLVALIAWYFYPTEYDKLMKEALKIKEVHPELKVFDGEVEPEMPNAKENNKTILGIDSNKNGIRDDVDIWINRTALDYNERMAMRQYARAQQERLRVCEHLDKSKMTMDEIAKMNYVISKVQTDEIVARSCLYAVSDYHHKEDYMQSKIWTMYMNNNSRKDCPHAFDKFLYSFGGGEGSSGKPHESCNFAIENKDQVIKTYRKFWGFVE